MHRVNARPAKTCASVLQPITPWCGIHLSSLMQEPDDETGLGSLLVTVLYMDPEVLQGYGTRVSSSYINLNCNCLHLSMPHPANPKSNVGSCHVNRCPSTTTTNPSPLRHPHHQQHHHRHQPRTSNPKPYNPKPKALNPFERNHKPASSKDRTRLVVPSIDGIDTEELCHFRFGV